MHHNLASCTFKYEFPCSKIVQQKHYLSDMTCLAWPDQASRTHNLTHLWRARLHFHNLEEIHT